MMTNQGDLCVLLQQFYTIDQIQRINKWVNFVAFKS